MATYNEKEPLETSEPELSNDSAPPVTGVVSKTSYDIDTPAIQTKDGREPVRVKGVGGSEISKGTSGFGSAVLRTFGVDTDIADNREAEYFRDGLYAIYGGSEATVTDPDGRGVFGRLLGNLEVEGVDWRHMMYELGASDVWVNYGYDPKDSVERETYKWYAGQTQSTNVDAYKLLESGVAPDTIISDRDFAMANQLQATMKAHVADAAEGVVDVEAAKETARIMMSRPDLLSKAQKRRWYEMAQRTNIGEMMLLSWNDPFTRADIEGQSRVLGIDSAPRTDTSYWAALKNGAKQWYGTGDQHDVGEFTKGTFRDGTKVKQYDEQAVLDYISENNLAPNIAAKVYDTFLESGGVEAIEAAEFERIDQETMRLTGGIDKKNGFEFVAKSLVHGAAPYVTDPAVWMSGGVAGGVTKVLTAKAISKATSPVVQKLVFSTTMGAGTALGESMAFTGRNYKDFTNDEILEVWATDAAFGAAFGFAIQAGLSSINKYGNNARAKAAGEGIDELDIVPNKPEVYDEDFRKFEEDAMFKVREEENRMFDEAEGIQQVADDAAYADFARGIQDRLDEMQTEVAAALSSGKTEVFGVTLDVKPPVTVQRAEPVLDPETQTDLRTPEELEAAEDLHQANQVDEALKHQTDVVQPKLADIQTNHNWLAKIHRALGKSVGMQEMASKLIHSADAKTSFIGTRILETGVGFTGKVVRRATAALAKDSIYTRHVSNLNKAYVDNIKGWAMEGGASKYKAWKAAYEGGKVNDVAKAFHREVFKYQEMLQAGKKPTKNTHIENYLEQLNKTNAELFKGRIDARVKGFSEERQIKNYIPHVWKKVKVEAIVNQFGEDVVLELLEESIESAKRAGKIADDKPTRELAERQLNWINGLGDAMEYAEQIGTGVSGRAKSRIPLDFTVEKNGLSMVDLVDTDIPTLMDSYIQRASADIGISQATDGLIRSEGDFDKFLTPDSEFDKQLMKDAKDMLYGRPTREGMSPELRSVMDLVTIQQMGGIGAAQLAETGTMAQRLIVNYMSQPKIAKKIWKLAGEDINDKGVLHQIRSISAVNDNMRYINRYSVNNIDQAQVEELSNLRAASLDAVDKATLGAYKAQFGRALGALSGVDAVQQMQSRLLQSSFAVDVARAASFGKGTSTKARLADLGLKESGEAFTNIRKHVEFDEDGFPKNFNFDKWDKKALDQFVYAMNREEAQLMPRVMSGELPVFMNRPMWQAVMQFRKTPLAFMSKGTQRNLQFADREAVFGTVLNAMTAGLARYAKLALGAIAYTAISDEEFRNPDIENMQVENYVSNLGVLGDTYNLSKAWTKAYQQKDGIESMWEGAKQVPVVSTVDSAYNALHGDPSAIKKSMPLNTLPMVNEITNAVVRNIEEQ